MKILNILIPPFLRRLNDYLLVNHPFIWKTRVHYFLFYSLGVVNLLAIGLGLLYPVSMKQLPSYELIKDASMIMAFFSGIVYLLWIFLLNRDKKDILTLGRAGLSIGIYFICILSLCINALTFSYVIRFKVNSLISSQEFKQDYEDYTQELLHLSHLRADQLRGYSTPHTEDPGGEVNVKDVRVVEEINALLERESFIHYQIRDLEIAKKKRLDKLYKLEVLEDIDPTYKEYLIKHYTQAYQSEYSYEQWYLDGNSYNDELYKNALMSSAKVRRLMKKYQIQDYSILHLENKIGDILRFRATAITFPLYSRDSFSFYNEDYININHVNELSWVANWMFLVTITLLTFIAFVSAQLKAFNFKKLILSIILSIGLFTAGAFTIFMIDRYVAHITPDEMDSVFGLGFMAALISSGVIMLLVRRFSGAYINLWTVLFTAFNLVPVGIYLLFYMISMQTTPPEHTGFNGIPFVILPIVVMMFVVSYKMLRRINLTPTRK